LTEPIRTFVALGDSFTGGTDTDSGERWPDHVAQALGPAVRYENLACNGATSAEVEERQLPDALALRPDLVSVVCGANDVLESVRPDVVRYADRLSGIFARLRAESPSAVLLTATCSDLSRFLDLRPRTRARVQDGMRRFNAATRTVAERQGALLLDWALRPETEERRNFAPDGLHLSPAGHRAAAADVLRALTEAGLLAPRASPEKAA
jgi:lysophospholipase L1-like esterase